MFSIRNNFDVPHQLLDSTLFKFPLITAYEESYITISNFLTEQINCIVNNFKKMNNNRNFLIPVNSSKS